MNKKSMLEVNFFLRFSTPARSNSAHFDGSASLEMQLFKISFTLGDFKSGIYLFNGSAQINFGNASLFPVIRSE